MKHLRKYNESNSQKELNQDYLNILDAIQYVLDDFGVNQLPKEAEGDGNTHGAFLEDNSNNSYWGFGINGAKTSCDTKEGCYTSTPLEFEEISLLCIWNVWGKDKDKFENALYEELDRLMEITGKAIVIKYDAVASDLGDFVIEITQSLDDVYNGIRDSIDLDDKFERLNDNQKKEVINLMIKLKSYL